MEVYGWLAAQLMYHAGEAVSFFVLRHLMYKMHLYNEGVIEMYE